MLKFISKNVKKEDSRKLTVLFIVLSTISTIITAYYYTKEAKSNLVFLFVSLDIACVIFLASLLILKELKKIDENIYSSLLNIKVVYSIELLILMVFSVLEVTIYTTQWLRALIIAIIYNYIILAYSFGIKKLFFTLKF